MLIQNMLNLQNIPKVKLLNRDRRGSTTEGQNIFSAHQYLSLFDSSPITGCKFVTDLSRA